MVRLESLNSPQKGGIVLPRKNMGVLHLVILLSR